MHGRKKIDRVPTEQEIAALTKKRDTYGQLVKIIFERKLNNDYTLETLELTGKLLKINPDFYTLWNYRREILLTVFPNVLKERNSESSDEINDIKSRELQLSAEGIQKNPKSYGAWHHRQWIFEHLPVNVEEELKLCHEFLFQDQRNFHCWNYRRFVVIKANIPMEDELQFSTEKIQENFSNYSAFHHRSIFIKKSGLSIQSIIPSEFAIIENAVFTEPDDQSVWWYHQFLLTWVLGEVHNNSTDFILWFTELLKNQLDTIKSLIELENNCKWAKCCLVSIINTLLQLSYHINDNKIIEKEVLMKEKNETLQLLIDIDPIHKNRYSYLINSM
eukprot:gene10803-14502_t